MKTHTIRLNSHHNWEIIEDGNLFHPVGGRQYALKSQAEAALAKLEAVTDAGNAPRETQAENYGRRCADAMNARDTSLYNHLRNLFNHLKIAARDGETQDKLNSEFNAAYRANRTIP